jgi:hypothetical protein
MIQRIQRIIQWLEDSGFRTFIFLFSLIFIFAYPLHLKYENWECMDLRSFYVAGQAVSEQANPYDLNYLKQHYEYLFRQQIFPYLYAPPLAQIIAVFHDIPYKTFQTIWLWLCACLSAGLLTLICIYFRKFRINNALILTILLYLALPFQEIIKLGQIDIFIMIFFLMPLLYPQYKVLSGIMAGIAVILKHAIFPLYLFFFLLKPEHRKSMLAGSLLIAGLSFAAAPRLWVMMKTYYDTLPLSGQVPGLLEPYTIHSTSLLSLLERAQYLPFSSRVTSLIIAGIMLIPVIILIIRSQQKQSYVLPFSIIMLLSFPMLWGHHIVWLLPGIICLINNIRNSGLPILSLIAGITVLQQFQLSSIPMSFILQRLSINPEWNADMGPIVSAGATGSLVFLYLLSLYIAGWTDKQLHARKKRPTVG